MTMSTGWKHTNRCRTTHRQAFTLVELLVVFSIISLLVALLLPALSSAMEASRRAACGSDRRQNGMSLSGYISDNYNRLPQATSFADANGYSGLQTYGDMGTHPTVQGSNVAVSLHAGASSKLYASAGVTVAGSATNGYLVFPTGTMVRRGYMPDPRVLFCPSYNRPSFSAIQDNWDKSVGRAYFNSLAKGELMPGTKGGNLNMGISALFPYNSKGTGSSTTADCSSDLNITIDQIEAKAYSQTGKYTGVSPVMWACLNLRQSSWNTPADQVESLVNQQEGLSHQAIGVNCAFYDGSVQWISRDKVKARGWLAAQHLYTGWGGTTSTTAGTPEAAYMLNNEATGGNQYYLGNFVIYLRNFKGR